MIENRLLEILVCPESQTRLAPAEAGLLDKLNQAIARGNVKNRVGQTVSEPLTAGLVREDGTLLYPILDDIPVMLIDEAIPLDQIS